MTNNTFELNEQTLSVIEEIGGHMPGGFFIYQAETPEKLLYVNKAAINIFGCADLEDFKELTGYTFKGMVHPDDYQRISDSIVQQIGTNKDQMDYTEYRIIRKNGDVRWVDDYGHYTETKSYGGIYVVFISDITEKVLSQEKHQKDLDSMITAMASDYRSVYHVDIDADDAVCYRADPNDPNQPLEGTHFPYLKWIREYGDLYVDEEYRENFRSFSNPDNIRAALATRDIIAYRYLARRDGTDYYEMLRMAGVRHPKDRDDNIVHAIGLGFTDIDAEMRESLAKNRALSEALKAAEEANIAKTAFLSNMSHEIRTPMNAIIGLDSLALQNEAIPSETREYLEKIGESAHHLLGLINDILDMSRIESGRLVIRKEEFSFRNMLEQINTMVMSQCEEKGLNYECRVIGGVSDFYIGDDMKLKQVLINILSNAIKFTDAPGDVMLTVERINVFGDHSTIKFCIKDTGIGMDKEFIPKIFDAFTQEDSSRNNKYGSTGLGMAITKNIVELMNGTISVESEKGVGTEFTVIITLNNSNRQGPATYVIDPKDMRILVVDDEEIAAEHARIVLDEAGIKADTCYDGQTAMNMLEVQHAKHEPYNLVLLDWKMPEMDGVELAREIRKRYDRGSGAQRRRQLSGQTFVCV